MLAFSITPKGMTSFLSFESKLFLFRRKATYVSDVRPETIEAMSEKRTQYRKVTLNTKNAFSINSSKFVGEMSPTATRESVL